MVSEPAEIICACVDERKFLPVMSNTCSAELTIIRVGEILRITGVGAALDEAPEEFTEADPNETSGRARIKLLLPPSGFWTWKLIVFGVV